MSANSQKARKKGIIEGGGDEVVISEPDFINGTATVTINKTGSYGEKGVLKVTLIDNDGQEISVSRVVAFYSNALAVAAQNGGTYTLEKDMKLTEQIEVPAGKTFTLDLGGKTLSNTDNIWNDDSANQKWSAISVQGGTLVIKNGTIQTKEDDCYAIDVRDGGKVVVESGTYVGNIHAVYVFDGSLEIKDGTFSVQQKFNDTYPNEYVINCYDANYKNGTATVSITGGTFVNFNPANCRAEGEGTNFVAEGYYSQKAKEENSNTYYEVKQIEAITSADSFLAAIKAEASSIVLGGDVDLSSSDALSLAQNQAINLQGHSLKVKGLSVYTDKSNVSFTNGTIEMPSGSLGVYSNSHLTLDGVTLNSTQTNGTAIVCGFHIEAADKEKSKNNTLTIRNSVINVSSK